MKAPAASGTFTSNRVPEPKSSGGDANGAERAIEAKKRKPKTVVTSKLLANALEEPEKRPITP